MFTVSVDFGVGRSYGRLMAWVVRFTDEAAQWYRSLSDADADKIAAAFDELTKLGPATGRPHADRIRGSRHHHMKEARSAGHFLRALFAFDHRREAIVLVGGDKRNDWTGWYARAIKQADRLYDTHLRDSNPRGERWPLRRAGENFAQRDR